MDAAIVRQKLATARKRLESQDVSARGLRNALNDVLDILEEVLEDAEQDEWLSNAFANMSPEGD